MNRDDSTLSKIDPATGKVANAFKVGVGPVDAAVGAGVVWVTSSGDGKVLRVDPATGSVLGVSVGRGPGAIAVTPKAVWVVNGVDGTVSRIDPQALAVKATIPVEGGASGIAAGPGGVWVASGQAGSISRIEPATNTVSKTVSIGSSPAGVAVGPQGVFVAVRPTAGAHRGGTLTMVNEGWPEYDPGSIDPAVSISVLLGMTNDGLTAFKRVGGRESAEIVPDLAIALPQATDDGKTYTFRLRKDIRYSTGQPVRAGDFQRGLERVFELASEYPAPLYASIVGAEACLRHPKGCNLSKGVVADDSTGTVTFHLTAPDPDFLAKLALNAAVAVPEGTPSRDMGTRPLPATGPYRIASYVPQRQIRLVRNARFREWSHAATPAGYPDEIVIRLGLPDAAQVNAAGRGQADVADLTNARVLGRAAELRARYGARLHSVPGPYGFYLFLNTRLAPFDDVRVRRALSYALDREGVVQAAGGPEVVSASCQILPQNYPSYRPYCPHQGDLAEAKRLVAASGTRGTPVVVWTRASYTKYISRVVATLRELGYPARLKAVDDRAYYDALRKAGPGKVQIGHSGWFSEFPSAGNYMTGLLASLADATGFSDKAIERQIRRAGELQQTDPSAASELWARIDRMVTDRAPLVPMYNTREVVLTSGRVGNFQFHPLGLTLLDQLWVR